MGRTQTAIITLGAVIIVAAIMGAIVFSIQQGTERRKDCTAHGGTWWDSKCLILQPGQALE